MKRQSNIVAAALNNYERLDEILKISQQSAGSAMREQEEYAKSIQYSIDTLKASYQDLSQTVIKSDFVKTLLGTAQSFLEVLTKIIDKFGVLPTLLTSIAAVGSFKGKGIFGTITDELDESVKHITVFKKQWTDIQTNIKKSDTTGLSKIGIALEGVRLKAVATEIAVSALNAALTLGLSAALSLAVKGISTLVDKIVVTKEELDESRNIVAQDIQNLTQDIKELTDKKDDIDELLARYKEIVLSAEDISKNKDELIQIQDSIIDKFGAEKESLDLLNSSYDDAITKIKELSDTEYVEWQRQNASKIAKAEKVANLNVGWKQLEDGRIVEPAGSYTETFYKGSVDRDNELVASLFKIKGVSQDIADIYKEIDGLDFLDDLFSNSVLLTGDIYQAQEQLGQLIDKYKNFEDYDNKTLNILEEHYRSIKEIIEDIDAYYKSVNQFTASDTKVFTLDFNNLKDLEQLNTTLVDARDKWFENMSDMSKETIETVDTITKALQTLATGNGLTHNDFWELVKIDKDNMLTDIKQIGDSFVLNQEQLVALKDTYIRQQIDSLKAENKSLQIKQNELQTTIDQSEVEMSILGARGLVNEESRKAMDNARKSVVQGKKNLEQYGEQIRYNNMLINEWTAKLGDTVDKTQLIKDLQEKADIAEKAMNTAIDSKLKALNGEKTVLESQKEVLNEQLEILETQRKKIEDIINDYETVGNIVKDEAERQIKTLEDEKKAQEDIVQAKIEALKESKEAQDKENALIEKELELKRKLSDLEKAKNTKVRTYSTERGYHFDVDKEAVVSAEEEVSKAQQAYNQAVAEDLYDKQLESLEKEKDEITKNFDEQIKTVQEYSNLWADAIKEQTTAENERLAQQILGLAWREKINKADISILNNFKSNLKQYNTQLTNLVNNEIKQLKNSITAKDEEIQAKQRQIKVWQDYKTEVQDAIERVKNKYSEYVDELGGVISAENLSYENREEALRNFIVTYEGLVDEIARQQGRIQDVHAGIYIDTNVSQVSSEMANFIDSYRSAIESMQKSLDESLTGYGIVNSAWDARLAAAANALRRGYSSGGVADYTGFAMLHGSKNSAETIFNAAQSKELYDMVRTGKFSMQVANKAYEGIASALMTTKSKNTNNSNTIINLHQEFHNMHDGRKFAEEFNKNISQYWRTELTKSMVQ